MGATAGESIAPGATLQERYRILGILGEGGMGAVYLAEDLRFPGRQWAVKEMKLRAAMVFGRVEDAVEKFREEARLLADLHHENLPQMVDLFEQDGSWFMVMERVPGRTLQQIMDDRKGPLPEEEALSVAMQVLDALDYLHTRPRPIIYRDLKASNVMVTPQNRVVLIDFGIARFFDPSKQTDTFKVGSNGYAPPEQYQGKGTTDARSDLYSLGALLHFMVTGRDPQREAPFFFPPARSFEPRVSPKTEATLIRSLELEREHRFATAREMHRALAGSQGFLWRIPAFRRFLQSRKPIGVQLLPGSRREQIVVLRILLFILAFALAHMVYQVVQTRHLVARRAEAARHSARALSLMETGARDGYREAARECQKAIDLRGEDAVLLYHLGLASARAGDDEGARRAFTRSLQLHPSLGDSHREMAALCLRGSDPTRALDYLDEAARHAPEDPAVVLLKARALEALGRKEEAGKARTCYTEMVPDSARRARLEALYGGP